MNHLCICQKNLATEIALSIKYSLRRSVSQSSLVFMIKIKKCYADNTTVTMHYYIIIIYTGTTMEGPIPFNPIGG